MAQLADFNFSIKSHPGKSNVDADGLSQMPVNIDRFMEQCTGGVSQEVISASIQGVLVGKDILLACVTTTSVKDLQMVSDSSVSVAHKPLTPNSILESQKNDPVISRVLQ